MKVINIALGASLQFLRFRQVLGEARIQPKRRGGSGVINWRVKITRKSLSFHHIQH